MSLFGTAISTGTNIAFSHPQKVETWLNQSNLYGHFESDTISKAIQAAGSSESQASGTLGGSAVQQAANSTFTSSLFQKYVNTFLDSNYSWLEGKTSQPNFKIDLTEPKTNFASQVGQYVQDHMASLPTCTVPQLEAIGTTANIDPLNITCRPASISAQSEAALVTKNIQSSTEFLSNPVITADNFNPKASSETQPYYKKFSRAPKLYQLSVKLPWIYAVIAVISAVVIIFTSRRKRRGLKHVGGELLLVGGILILFNFVYGTILKNLEKQIFNHSSVGQIQQAITSFMNLAAHELAKVYLLFGIGYIVLAAVIFLVLIVTKHRTPRIKIPDSPKETVDIASRFRSDPQNYAPAPKKPTPTGPPAPPKRPKLIQ